jgi:hypothetical protein
VVNSGSLVGAAGSGGGGGCEQEWKLWDGIADIQAEVRIVSYGRLPLHA